MLLLQDIIVGIVSSPNWFLTLKAIKEMIVGSMMPIEYPLSKISCFPTELWSYISELLTCPYKCTTITHGL